MSAQAIREAVELATIVANAADLPTDVVSVALAERLDAGPVRSLTAQASLCGALGRLAEARVAALLVDAEALTTAAQLARAGRPLTPEAIGVTRDALLAEAGVSAARLG